MQTSRPLAVITGASSGLGAEFARQLAARGHGLVLVARRRERLEELAAALGGAEVLVADLSSEEGIAAVERRLASADDLDLLVNNAGFGSRGLFFEQEPGIPARMHMVHVIATERLSRAALPVLLRRGRGGIINVSSVAAFMSSPGNVSYHATKTWINAFTEGLYLELRQVGSAVRVQALCPGFTYTEFHDVIQAPRSGVPKKWWMRAEYVVAECLRGYDEGRLFVIPGFRYKAIVALMRILPRGIAHAIMIRASARYRKG